MLYVTTPFWKPNHASYNFSRCYDESWVEKLYRGFKRNLTKDFTFLVFVDEFRQFKEPAIGQVKLQHRPIGYGSCIEPYKLGEPMILVGLDTVITGNIDHFADYCLTETKIAVPKDPYAEGKSCNGVALVPKGNQDVFTGWSGQNDMEWIRSKRTECLDDLFPGQVKSYKAHVRENELGDARIVYFHGKPKMHEIDDPQILRHWV